MLNHFHRWLSVPEETDSIKLRKIEEGDLANPNYPKVIIFGLSFTYSISFKKKEYNKTVNIREMVSASSAEAVCKRSFYNIYGPTH